MITIQMTARDVIAMTVVSAVMTDAPLVVAMPAAAAHVLVLLVDVHPSVVHAARVMIAASAANADRIAEMDSIGAMIARKVIASRRRLLFKV